MKIPKFVLDKYPNGERGFKSSKRKEIRKVLKAMNELRFASAYIPRGNTPLAVIVGMLEDVKLELSIKRWGR